MTDDAANHALMSDEPGWQQCLDAIDGFIPGPAVPPSSAGFERLTPRQRQILELVAQGRVNTDIAETLNLSPKTVRNQVSVILDQLGVSSRGQAIVSAREAGFGRSAGHPASRVPVN